MVFLTDRLEEGFFRPRVDPRFDPENESIEFQVVDWADSDDFATGKNKGKTYNIRMYGVTREGHSVCAHVSGFEPYFYIRVPDGWGKNEIDGFYDGIKQHMTKVYDEKYPNKKSQSILVDGKKKKTVSAGEALAEDLIRIDIVNSKKLYWYDGGTEYPFMKLIFKNKATFSAYKGLFLDGEPFFIREIDNVHPFDFSRSVYEANIEPMIRFIHHQDINPTGWVRLDAASYDFEETSSTRAQYNFVVPWSNVVSVKDCVDIAPYIVAAFDIECCSSSGDFPVAANPEDPVVQIGVTVHKFGEKAVSLRYIVTQKVCADFTKGDPNVIVQYIEHDEAPVFVDKEEYDLENPDEMIRYEAKMKYDAEVKKLTLRRELKAERRLLMAWAEFMDALDPDVLVSYNGWGFDMEYLFERANNREAYDEKAPYSLTDDGREFLELLDRRTKPRGKLFIKKKLESSGLGQNFLSYFGAEGIVQIDVMKVIQADVSQKLESYTLNYVSELYLGDQKADLSPQQLFKNYKSGTPDEIAEIAIYCLKDCELCNRLLMKRTIDTNAIGMSNVCTVPLSYIFTRGQGVKLFSLLTKFCLRENVRVPVLKKEDIDPSSYEGAIVFEALIGIYTIPIEVLDYSSLYPSSMIAENISHDTLVLTRTFDLDGKLIREEGRPDLMGLAGYVYNKIVYDMFEKVFKQDKETPDEIPDPDCPLEGADGGAGGDEKGDAVADFFKITAKNKVVREKKQTKEEKAAAKKPKKIGFKECYYIEREGCAKENKGILPRIEMGLLAARKTTRKKIEFQTVVFVQENEQKTAIGTVVDDYSETEVKIIPEKGAPIVVAKADIISAVDTYDDAMKKIFDGLQMAFKVVCNSLYGQVGATVSPMCFKELAASTTAVGRRMLTTARDLIEAKYTGARIIYGDTDSNFIDFTPHIKLMYGEGLSIQEIREHAERLGHESSKYVNSHLKYPQDLTREKQLYPFILFSKKRYISIKYEKDLIKGKEASMGIATKRRDNARFVVDDIYGGTLRVILKKLDIEASKVFFQEKVRKLLGGGYTPEELTVTKSVKSTDSYKNPCGIAQRVLADRMTERDAGNRVMPGERVPYAFIETSNLKCCLIVCGKPVQDGDCKCVCCEHLYCPTHIGNHRRHCVWRCRFCKVLAEPAFPILSSGENEDRAVEDRRRNFLMPVFEKMKLLEVDYASPVPILTQFCMFMDCVYDQGRRLFICNTCHGIYCLKDMHKHRLNENEEKGTLRLDRCKKPLGRKLLQGDRIETPAFIKAHGYSLDYRYYLERQIMNPCMQLFGLVMPNPESLVEAILSEDTRRKMGMKSITSYFGAPQSKQKVVEQHATEPVPEPEVVVSEQPPVVAAAQKPREVTIAVNSAAPGKTKPKTEKRTVTRKLKKTVAKKVDG